MSDLPRRANHTFPSSNVISRDLRGVLRERYDAPSGSKAGFYRRSTRQFAEQSQSEFAADAYSRGRLLQGSGVQRGQYVVIAIPGSELAIRCFFACVSIGAVPVLMAARPAFDDTSTSANRVRDLLSSLPSNCAVVHPTGRPPQGCPAAVHTVEMPSEVSHYSSLPIDVPDAKPDELAYLQLSSGSAERPKPVAITHAAIIANCQSLEDRSEVTAADVFTTWLPMYHDMGLVALMILPLALGADFFLMSPYDFLSNPSLWLRTISDKQATVTGCPPFGFQQSTDRIRASQIEGVDLSSLRRAYTGAEPVDGEILRNFQERFSAYGLSPTAIKPSYGMAEATVMLAMADVDEGSTTLTVATADAMKLGKVRPLQRGSATVAPCVGEFETEISSAGRPATDVDLWLTGFDDSRIEQDLSCGEVTVSCPSLGAGYLRPDGTIDPFDRTAFRTGDVGFMSEGNLFLVERKRNIIIRHGQNISAQAIETTLSSVTGYSRDQLLVIDSDIATGRGRITALVELDRKSDPGPVTATVLASLDRFSPPLDDLILLRPGAIPRTTSGKKRHIEARRMLADGSLRIVELHEVNASATPRPEGQPTAIIDLVSHETADAVRDVVAAFARLRGSTAAVTGATSFAGDLGLDSLAMYELAMAVEEKAKVELRESDLAIARTVADLSAICISRRRDGTETGSSITSAIHAAAEPPPQALNNVTAQKGRQVEIDGRWVTDFASCNYLGLDLHPDVMASIDPMVRKWGTHPSWTRVVASPAPYRELEGRLADLIGVTDTVVFPTVTLLHMGVLPTLAGPNGVIFIDTSAHQSLQQAADLAKSDGTAVARFVHDDLTQLEASLNLYGGGKNRIIAVDGIYSMSGSTARLKETIELAKRFDATVYVDDAHGFGVIGENPTKETPFGFRGNGVINHLGLDYENVIYVAGLSKAYSSMGAFVSAESPAQRRIYESANTLIFGGPIPVASLATAIAGLDVSAVEGDAIRQRLWDLSKQLIHGVRSLGLPGDNGGGFPIVNVEIGSVSDTISAAHTLWDDALLITPSMFPAMPLDRGGVRFTLTAANTEEEVAAALRSLAKISQSKLVAV